MPLSGPLGLYVPILKRIYSGVSSIDVTGLAPFQTIRGIISNYVPASGGSGLIFVSSTDNGSTYDTPASGYCYQGTKSTGTTTSSFSNSGDTTLATPLDNVGAGLIGSFGFSVEDFNKASYMNFRADGGYQQSSSVLARISIWGARLDATPRNAFTFGWGGPTFSANLVLEGIRG